MNASLFGGSQCKDEYSLLKTESGQAKIQHHHQTFITEEDFKWLKAHDIEIIRLPFGWWVFDDFEPWVGHIEQLDFTINMAEKYHLKLLLDLHGLPGSQNGSDHSGQINGDKWLHPVNLNLTSKVLTKITTRYRSSTAFWGIEVANEPKVTLLNRHKILDFYHQIYAKLIDICPDKKIIFSDGYKTDFFNCRLPKGAILDKHHYQLFSDKLKNMLFSEHLDWAKKQRPIIEDLANCQPIIIGEWSLGLDKRPSAFSHRQLYFDAQYTALKSAEAIFFWNYKIDNPYYSDWNYRWLIDEQQISPAETLANN